MAIKQAELDYAIAAKVRESLPYAKTFCDMYTQINFANSKMSAVEYRQRAFHSDNDQ